MSNVKSLEIKSVFESGIPSQMLLIYNAIHIIADYYFDILSFFAFSSYARMSLHSAKYNEAAFVITF